MSRDDKIQFNIGIDFDGVLNTDDAAYMSELEDSIARQLGHSVRDAQAKMLKDRYGLSDKDFSIYVSVRHDHINSSIFFSQMTMMPNAVAAIAALNKMGHKTFLLSARGCTSEWNYDARVRDDICNILLKWGLIDAGLIVDKTYSFSDPAAKRIDKIPQCENLGIDILIDDCSHNIASVNDAGVHTMTKGDGGVC